jgi:hypothetical protein
MTVQCQHNFAMLEWLCDVSMIVTCQHSAIISMVVQGQLDSAMWAWLCNASSQHVCAMSAWLCNTSMIALCRHDSGMPAWLCWSASVQDHPLQHPPAHCLPQGGADRLPLPRHVQSLTYIYIEHRWKLEISAFSGLRLLKEIENPRGVLKIICHLFDLELQYKFLRRIWKLLSLFILLGATFS